MKPVQYFLDRLQYFEPFPSFHYVRWLAPAMYEPGWLRGALDGGLTCWTYSRCVAEVSIIPGSSSMWGSDKASLACTSRLLNGGNMKPAWLLSRTIAVLVAASLSAYCNSPTAPS